jgi:hypothetical protein
MSTSRSIDALHRANPRNAPSFSDAVDAAAAEVRVRIGTAVTADRPRRRWLRPRRRLTSPAAPPCA